MLHALQIAGEDALQIVALEIQVDKFVQVVEGAWCDVADRVTAQIQSFEMLYVEPLRLDRRQWIILDGEPL